ncbi:MAG: type ISP restriction/modification enzyme, partial [Limisphaerales bacterium]
MSKIFYHAVPGDWRKEQKYQFLEKAGSIAGVKWQKLAPDEKGNWLTNDSDEEFDSFLPIGSKEAKAGTAVPTIFRTYSLGVSTNRDAVVYDFDAKRLAARVEQFAEDYNAELHRWRKKGKPKDVDNFVSYGKIKWSRNLKRWFRQEDELKFDKDDVRESAYRPFTNLKLHYARMFVDEFGTTYEFFPIEKCHKQNQVILVPSGGGRSPFWCFASNLIPNLNFVSIDSAQCLPLFSYSKDGKERRDNVTPQARIRFQNFYDDDRITQRDIFHYVYALLHHPAYRERFAENLKRDLPRIPFVGKNGMMPSLDEKTPKRTAAQTKA